MNIHAKDKQTMISPWLTGMDCPENESGSCWKSTSSDYLWLYPPSRLH